MSLIQNNFLQPPFLKKGDKILFIAPAGVFRDPDALQKAVAWVEDNGWQAEIHPSVYERFGSFSAPDEARAMMMQEAFERRDVAVIWAVRGGYGSLRIIDRLDFSPLRHHPKWLTGFSDITVFHARLFREKIRSLHAWMPVQMSDTLPGAVLETTASLLKGKPVRISVARDSMNRNEQAVEGILTGGNAATLLSCLTACRLSFKDAILFLEDTDEHLYALDRIFQSMRRAGIFKQIKALILGHFTRIKQDNPPFPYTVKQIVLQAVDNPSLPVFFGFPAGHEPENYPLMMGANYKISIDTNRWYLEPLQNHSV